MPVMLIHSQSADSVGATDKTGGVVGADGEGAFSTNGANWLDMLCCCCCCISCACVGGRGEVAERMCG